MSRRKSLNQKNQRTPDPTLVWNTEMYFTCTILDELEANVL